MHVVINNLAVRNSQFSIRGLDTERGIQVRAAKVYMCRGIALRI